MNCFESEVSKYKKKKSSSTSKSKTKSKHKHVYEPCLLICDDHPHYATACKICGKIDHLKFSETELTQRNTHRFLSDNEIYHKYNHLEKHYIADLFQKYVP